MYRCCRRYSAGWLLGGAAERCRWISRRRALVTAAVVLTSAALPLWAAQVSLVWDAPTENIDGSPLVDLSGYRVYYAPLSLEYTNTVDVGETTSADISGLIDGQSYYFAVTAYNSTSNESPLSTIIVWNSDSDADGVPDAWEARNFPETLPEAVDASADADGDGLSNFEEFVAGTSPTDSASCLLAQYVVINGKVGVMFDAAEASGAGYEDLTRYYEIQQCQDLALANWIPVPGSGPIPGVGTTITYTEDNAEDRIHYRICSWLE